MYVISGASPFAACPGRSEDKGHKCARAHYFNSLRCCACAQSPCSTLPSVEARAQDDQEDKLKKLRLLAPRSALENIQAESGAAPGDVEMMMLDLANFE